MRLPNFYCLLDGTFTDENLVKVAKFGNSQNMNNTCNISKPLDLENFRISQIIAKVCFKKC